MNAIATKGRCASESAYVRLHTKVFWMSTPWWWWLHHCFKWPMNVQYPWGLTMQWSTPTGTTCNSWSLTSSLITGQLCQLVCGWGTYPAEQPSSARNCSTFLLTWRLVQIWFCGLRTSSPLLPLLSLVEVEADENLVRRCMVEPIWVGDFFNSSSVLRGR